ncbi:MAG TPA: hypothetical protein VGB75_09715 [Jatrophihabitans sp.]|uniref:hypothetical protein n=1 Tax=Jatrophihabitans sp. TaxID=1932789 RepID=UPI002EE604BF
MPGDFVESNVTVTDFGDGIPELAIEVYDDVMRNGLERRPSQQEPLPGLGDNTGQAQQPSPDVVKPVDLESSINEDQWKLASLVVPAATALAVALIAALIPVYLATRQSPASLDCADIRSKTAELYYSHPLAVVPYAASSQEEKQCQINEYEEQLKNP